MSTSVVHRACSFISEHFYSLLAMKHECPWAETQILFVANEMWSESMLPLHITPFRPIVTWNRKDGRRYINHGIDPNSTWDWSTWVRENCMLCTVDWKCSLQMLFTVQLRWRCPQLIIFKRWKHLRVWNIQHLNRKQ